MTSTVSLLSFFFTPWIRWQFLLEYWKLNKRRIIYKIINQVLKVLRSLFSLLRQNIHMLPESFQTCFISTFHLQHQTTIIMMLKSWCLSYQQMEEICLSVYGKPYLEENFRDVFYHLLASFGTAYTDAKNISESAQVSLISIINCIF